MFSSVIPGNRSRWPSVFFRTDLIHGYSSSQIRSWVTFQATFFPRDHKPLPWRTLAGSKCSHAIKRSSMHVCVCVCLCASSPPHWRCRRHGTALFFSYLCAALRVSGLACIWVATWLNEAAVHNRQSNVMDVQEANCAEVSACVRQLVLFVGRGLYYAHPFSLFSINWIISFIPGFNHTHTTSWFPVGSNDRDALNLALQVGLKKNLWLVNDLI